MQPRVCRVCAEKVDAEKAYKKAVRNVRKTLAERWLDICVDDEYQRADAKLLPRPEKWREASAWKFGPKGLVLCGPSRQGKSMTLYLLGKREHFAGRDVVAVSDYRFGHQCTEAWREFRGEKWVRRHCECELLLLDDMGKMPLTDRTLGELSCVIEERTANGRPMLITTEYYGEDLVIRLGKERGWGIVGRLRDKRFFDSVDFRLPEVGKRIGRDEML